MPNANQKGKCVTTSAVSRRTKAGPYALAAGAMLPFDVSARAEAGLPPGNEATIREWYAAREQKDWRPVDMLLADNFTFTSAAGDDHVSAGKG